jgi:hypothetical protein
MNLQPTSFETPAEPRKYFIQTILEDKFKLWSIETQAYSQWSLYMKSKGAKVDEITMDQYLTGRLLADERNILTYNPFVR